VKEYLSRAGVVVEERDIFRKPLTEAELRDILSGQSPSAIFSTRSPTIKKLGLEIRKLTDQDMLQLMAQEPRLIRRPIVRVDGRIVIGDNIRMLDETLSL
jgi:arsenate reductase-like glutaredoxin family protein